MISLVLPYWNRQQAADKALASIWKQYPGMLYDGTLEVVLVDDGSRPAFVAPKGFPNLKVVTLPEKGEPKSPCLCWNEGVKAALGETVVLSCVEIVHEKPILAEMQAELSRSGPDAYVLAAAFCPETGEWHCHSQHAASGAYPLPEGTGRGFCAMLSKNLYERTGGWDEEYRDGAGYEDVDWVYRLMRAKARFVMRDDLVVIHPKTGASIPWGAEKFARNKALLERKWLQRRNITVACVQAQNYCGRGAEYVNVLHDSIVRNMPPMVDLRFVCLTDDPTGLDDGIETIALPKDLEGWYGKLYLFKRGLFKDGERVVFMDLDTMVIGRLDELVEYQGPFATLMDFYFPERIGPAVMLWEAGDYSASIWDEWVAADKPRNPLGDLWWLNNLYQGRFAKRIDKLQDLYPGMFVSYKQSCIGRLPPKGARVICFHGHPRPHEAQDEWVQMGWKIGGLANADFQMMVNTSMKRVGENIRKACALPHPWLDIVKPHDGQALIVGGGPSLAEMLPEIRAKVSQGANVFAVNGAHDYLLLQGIVADWHVIIDARPENADFIKSRAKGYILASQCAPETFLRAAPDPVVVMHMNTEGVMEHIPPSIKPVNLISSGSTVGLAALAASYCMGFRQQFLYGMDSSYEDRHHAYEQPMNDHDNAIEAIAGGLKFKCAPWMVEQVQNFQALSKELAEDGCEIHVRSRGLLGHVAWLMMQQAEAA